MHKPFLSLHFRIKSIIVLAAIFILVSGSSDLIAQRESPYNLRLSEVAPEWVRKMYATDADPGVVMKLYDEYYNNHPFIKNQHTQYYKRWISGLSKKIVPNAEADSIYMLDYFANQNHRSSVGWTNVGPIDWDHDAAGKSYAPGSAHGTFTNMQFERLRPNIQFERLRPNIQFERLRPRTE